MARIGTAEKELLDAILAEGEFDEAHIRKLALRVATGGKTSAELRAELAADIDVRVPITIAPLLITPERLEADAANHGQIMAARVARNRTIMQGIALTILGAGTAVATGGGAAAVLSNLKPLVAGILALVGLDDETEAQPEAQPEA